jgi:Ankyrin repeats (3 copies)
MQHNELDLPLDVFYYMAVNHLEFSDIQVLGRTSSANQKFFTDPGLWIQKIANDFHLPENELRSLAFSGDSTALQLGYKRYSSFLKLANKMDLFETAFHSNAIQFFVKDKTKQLLLFICCTDHAPSFAQTIDYANAQAINYFNNLGLYYELTLRLGCTHIPKFICTDVCEANALNEAILDLTVLSGRLDMTCVLFNLLKSNSNFKLEISYRTLVNLAHSAIRSGKIAMLHYFIHEHHLLVTDIHGSFVVAAYFGHLDMVKYLLYQGVKINESIINFAAESGSIELVKYLINTHEQVPNQYTLLSAIRSGNNDLCNFLTKHFARIDPTQVCPEIYARSKNPELQFSNLAPIVKSASIEWRQKYLDGVVVLSGHLELLKIALAPISLPDGTKAQIFPTQQTLYVAAFTGHLEMVQFLLDFPSDVKLKLDNRILNAAIDSKNLALVHFLLHPTHRFYMQDNLPKLLMDSPEGSLLQSHQSFLHALRLMRDSTADKQIQSSVDVLFNISFDSHLEHCTQMFQDVLLHPSCYNLNKNAAQAVQELFKKLLDDKLKQRNDVKSVVSFGTRIILASTEWLGSHAQQIADVIDKLDDANRSHLKFRV